MTRLLHSLRDNGIDLAISIANVAGGPMIPVMAQAHHDQLSGAFAASSVQKPSGPARRLTYGCHR